MTRLTPKRSHSSELSLCGQLSRARLRQARRGRRTFEEYFTPVRKYVDWWLNHSPSGTIGLLSAAHKYPFPGNWKWQAENGHDGYHGNYVHESWQRLLERAGEGAVVAAPPHEGGLPRAPTSQAIVYDGFH